MSLFDELNSIADLQQLIDLGERESEVLEYKAASAQMDQKHRDETAKDISAFANSLGGLIIYGVATDTTDRTKPVALEPISEWNINYLLHTAPSAIRHPITGIRTKTLPVGQKPQALLIDVPQSTAAPHQVVTRHLYYRREGATSVSMAHDLLELYFGRRTHPLLEPILKTEGDPMPGGEFLGTFRVTVGLLNTGGQIGRDVMTRLVMTGGSTDAAIAHLSNIIGAPSSREQLSPSERAFLHKELYYPGIPMNFVAFDITVLRHRVGKESPVAMFDIFASDTQPRRYSLFMTAQDSDLRWHLDWEYLGVPTPNI